jgi:hypothetical protein
MNKNCNSAIQHETIKASSLFLPLLATILLLTIYSPAQHVEQSGKIVKDKNVSAEYSRSSLTLLLLEPGRSSSQQRFEKIMRGIQIPDKFNDNNLDQRSLEVSGFERDADEVFFRQAMNRGIVPGSGLENIYRRLIQEHLTNQVIAKWWSRKDDGTFGVELLQERGAYDATDAEVIAARAGIRGMAGVMDAGEELINKSYILVFDFYNTKTMEQYYNDVDNNRREIARQLEREYTPLTATWKDTAPMLWPTFFALTTTTPLVQCFTRNYGLIPEKTTYKPRMLKNKDLMILISRLPM